MILPGSQLYNLILLAFGMLCWGLWANTFKMTSKWRFELYCFDFAVGVVLASLIAGFTFGTFGWDGFAVMDDLRVGGKREEALAAVAGIVFNLGNMLMLGGLSIAGITVTYVIGLGFMLTAGMVITWFTAPSGNAVLLITGAVLIVGAAIALAVAARMNSLARLAVLMREGKTKSTKKVVSVKGLILAALGGIVAAGYFPLASAALATATKDNGVGPYTLGICFAFGLALSTLLFSLFFMNLPVHGNPLEMGAYFQGKAKSHWLGILGGVLWYVGFLAIEVVARAEGRNILKPVEVRSFMLAAPVVGALFGLFRWKDFAGAEGKIRAIVAVALTLFVIGIVGLSAAAGFSAAG
jgi:glucose uptake protein